MASNQSLEMCPEHSAPPCPSRGVDIQRGLANDLITLYYPAQAAGSSPAAYMYISKWCVWVS